MPIPTSSVINPLFQPAARTITAITNAYPALVNTSFAHNYVDGTIVRLYIPPFFGMQQADQLTGTITNNGNPLQFIIDIDTINFSPFIVPVDQWWYNINANVVPIGEVNEILTAATHNSLG
jgi:hypothetical protein